MEAIYFFKLSGCLRSTRIYKPENRNHPSHCIETRKSNKNNLGYCTDKFGSLTRLGGAYCLHFQGTVLATCYSKLCHDPEEPKMCGGVVDTGENKITEMAVYLKIIYFVIRQAHDDRVRR